MEGVMTFQVASLGFVAPGIYGLHVTPMFDLFSCSV